MNQVSIMELEIDLWFDSTFVVTLSEIFSMIDWVQWSKCGQLKGDFPSLFKVVELSVELELIWVAVKSDESD